MDTPLCFRSQSEILRAKAETELLLSAPTPVMFFLVIYLFLLTEMLRVKEEPLQGSHLNTGGKIRKS